MAKSGAGLSAKNGGGEKKKNETQNKRARCSFKTLLLLTVVVALLAIGWSIGLEDEAPFTKVVQTDSGPIRGEELTYEGFNFKAFKGIPYAAPPVGELRFKDPASPQKWTKVRDTRDFGNICVQPNMMANMFRFNFFIRILPTLIKSAPVIMRNIFKMKSQSEDCLTLNVYTPNLGENGLKPVLFWIHGGGFANGDGTDALYGPQYLIQQNIVVVTINYRVGPLGFLSTGTPDATGNYGMKDQVAALKWVQENIAKFGGDPNQVTIYGESAGGTSVHLHLFSPLSKGLFHRAIPASGSAMNYWAVYANQEKFNKNLARLLGASQNEIEDPAERVRYLRQADSKKMTDIMFDVVEGEDARNPFINPLPFAPVIEPPGTKGAFLTENPKTLLKQGKFTKVPIMIGATDLEGALLYLGIGKSSPSQDIDRAINEVEENFCDIVPEVLREAMTAKGDCSKVSQQIRDVYFEGRSFNSSLLSFLHLFGDIILVSDIHVAQREHAKHATKSAPVYNYYFTFDGEWNVFKQVFLPPGLPGAAHGEELPYIFALSSIALSSLPPSSREVITRKRMISFITNFVKYGNPTPSVSDLVPVQWEQAKARESNVMVIGDDLKMEKDILKSRMEMWDQLYKTYT